MQYNGPTWLRPATVPEPPFNGRIVERSLRVWAISRWRGARELAEFFLAAGYRHLPRGTPLMFSLQNQYDGHAAHVIGLFVTFSNPYDAHYLLGQVYWCGCEFIAFTTYNVFTNFYNIFPTVNGMHALPYEDDE
jgi:hypothetical protein